MQQETAQELVCRQAHQLLLVAVCGVTPTEADVCHSSAQRVCGWRSRRDAGRRRDSAGRAPDLRRGLILADVLRTKLVGTAMKVLAEVLDSVNIRTDRGLGEVATLQLLNHELRRWVTGDLLPCDQS